MLSFPKSSKEPNWPGEHSKGTWSSTNPECHYTLKRKIRPIHSASIDVQMRNLAKEIPTKLLVAQRFTEWCRLEIRKED